MADGNSKKSNHCCFAYTWSGQYKKSPMPEDCPGVLATGYADGSPEEGYYIEVCPRTAWLGRAASGVVFCGLGPDVIVLHRDTVPTEDEYNQAARNADKDF